MTTNFILKKISSPKKPRRRFIRLANSPSRKIFSPSRFQKMRRRFSLSLLKKFWKFFINFFRLLKNHKGALVTINDRLTSKVWIRKLSGKDAAPLALKTIEALQPVKDLIHTITADNGKEFAKHQEIAEKLKISFYFCKPYHSWERGANENTNGLIRQYIPKGTDFSEITDEFVSWIENKLNNRPRKRLGYLTPNEKFNSILTN